MGQLSDIRAPEEIKAKFSIAASDCSNSNILTIKDGAVGYDDFIVRNINMFVDIQLVLSLRTIKNVTLMQN